MERAASPSAGDHHVGTGYLSAPVGTSVQSAGILPPALMQSLPIEKLVLFTSQIWKLRLGDVSDLPAVPAGHTLAASFPAPPTDNQVSLVFNRT